MKVATRAAGIAFALIGLAGLHPALSHHSFAMFDHDHQIKLAGTVSQFDWTNPHVYIELDAADAAGVMKHYTIECANPGILDRVGWKFNMIKVGDKITTIIAPLRTGEPGGLLKQVTLSDGQNSATAARQASPTSSEAVLMCASIFESALLDGAVVTLTIRRRAWGTAGAARRTQPASPAPGTATAAGRESRPTLHLAHARARPPLKPEYKTEWHAQQKAASEARCARPAALQQLRALPCPMGCPP